MSEPMATLLLEVGCEELPSSACREAVEQVPALPHDMKTDEKEMDIAEKLIGNLTASFDPAKYTDTYREALRRIIDDRIAGRQVVSQPDLPESNVIDLMEALKASVERTEQKNKAQKAPRKKQAT